MKKALYISLIIILAAGCCDCYEPFNNADRQHLKYERTLDSLVMAGADDSLAYIYGMKLAESIRNTGLNELSYDHIMQGMLDYLDYNEQIPFAEGILYLTTGVQTKQQDMNTENKAESDAYLAENAKRKGITVTETGLQYETLRRGTGKAPDFDDEVEVHYTGRTVDGAVFESTTQSGKDPIKFRLNGVIKGWGEGLQYMREGGVYRLYIPYQLAYGPGGNNRIAPFQALIFDIELLSVKRMGE